MAVSKAPCPRTARDLEGQRETRDFVAVVLADTEDVWKDLFRQMGRQYEEPRLVLFNGEVQSACGNARRRDGAFLLPARPQGVSWDLHLL